MKTTKILALVLALLMCVSMIACNNNTSNEGNTTDAQTTEAATEAATKAPDANNNNNNNNNEENNGDNGNENEGGDENNGNTVATGTVIYFNDFSTYTNTTDHSALTTLGWDQQTVEEDKVLGEGDVYFDFENGRLHVDTYSPNVGEGKTMIGHAFYTIPELSHEVMNPLMTGGYTLRYDIAYTPDLASAGALSSIIMDFSENNWTDAAVRSSGQGLFENITGGTAFIMNPSGAIATGKTLASSLSGVLVNKVPGATAPLINLSVTVMVKVDPVNGPVFYVKKSSEPDSAFIKVGETTMDNGYVGWMAAASRALALHTCDGLNAYYDNILVYAGTGDCPVTITYDNFGGGSMVGQTPGNGTIYYFEDFEDENTWSDRMMVLSQVAAKSAEICQKYGISLVNDGGLTTYMWIDNGRLQISSFSLISGDTRPKDTAGKYSFFKIAALDDATKMAALYGDKFTVQYDIAYGSEDVNGDGAVDYDTASWMAMFDIILNMDGDDGVACGVGTGGYVRLDYLTTNGTTTTNQLLTDATLMNRGQALGKKLRETDVGTITVRIVVDPTTNVIQLYAKTALMKDFVLVGMSTNTSAGYNALAAATSKSIGFALQYGNNALLDNLIVYSGDGNPPATDNQDNYYTEN